jgi:hypothetical protein
MAPLWWMAGVTVGAWLVTTAIVGTRWHPELLLGLAGPLLSAAATWVAIVRAYRSSPERLTGVMGVAFLAKMLFFAAYVIGSVRVLGARPVPFISSFTAFFIALYAMEAWFLRRLLVTPGSPGREPQSRIQ